MITFTDAIPDGLVPGQIVFNSCPTGQVTITPTSISYTATADFPAGGTCTIVVNVTATTMGTKNNSVSLAGVQAFASLTVNPPADSFQVRYASNLTAGDSVINITNTGVNGAPLNGPGFGGAAGNTCVNVYAFSPDEQLISCCSCLITPNGLVSLSVNQDLISNTLTGVRPNSVVVKLVIPALAPPSPAQAAPIARQWRVRHHSPWLAAWLPSEPRFTRLLPREPSREWKCPL